MARATLLACISFCLFSTAAAQESATAAPEDSADVLIFDHEFTGPNEFVRAFLQDGQVYRAELSSPDVTLELRGLARNTQQPRIYPFLNTDTPSGSSIVEIYPQADAQYEIRSVGVNGGPIATRMRLYRDVRASRRRYALRNTPGWVIGMELASGWHSGFLQSSAVPSLGDKAESGTDLEACFTARSAPGLGRLGMCVVGLDYQSQHGAKSILWIYTEPRLRLLGGPASNWELGTLLRFGAGIISASPDNPVILGPGGYISRYLGTGPRGAGWTLQASYFHAYFRGFSRPVGVESHTPSSDRLTLGVGWYR